MPKSNLCNFSVGCSPKTNVVWSCQFLECFIALESYVKNVNFDKIVTLGHRNSTFLSLYREVVLSEPNSDKGRLGNVTAVPVSVAKTHQMCKWLSSVKSTDQS